MIGWFFLNITSWTKWNFIGGEVVFGWNWKTQIGGDFNVKVSEGAAAGTAIGGTAGAIRGSNQDARINGGTQARPNLDKTTRYYDDQTGRYYYYEMGTSRTFYENNERRS